MMPEDAPKKPIDKSRRAVILATVGIVVILGLAVFYVALVAPLRETHRIIAQFPHTDAADIVKRLDGPESAVRRLATYLRLPRWMGTDPVVAIEILRWIGPEAKAAVPALVKTLEDSDTNVRWSAAEALGHIGPVTDEVMPALVKTLRDTNPNVRWFAAWALGEIGQEAKTAVPELKKLLVDPSGEVRVIANEALEKIRDEAPDAPSEAP